MIGRVQQFLGSVKFEMKKVSWPSWEELKGSTIVVLSFSLMLSLFLFCIDIILTKILNIVY